jgi:large subunit ribosomal protein L1
MSTKGKRYLDSTQRYDRQQMFSPAEAVDLVKALAKARFDETIEFAVRLGVDPRRADQIVRGSLALPSGTGKVKRVAVFAAGDAAAEARAEGADVVGSDDLVARIEKEGFLEFDVAIATPDLMAQVGRLGRVLGPRGLMPNPKTGTVTTDGPVGKASFESIKLLDNVRAVIEELQRVKPAASKGRYFRSMTLASTMGPGVHIDTNRARITEEDLAATA